MGVTDSNCGASLQHTSFRGFWGGTIIKKRLDIDADLYTILQILSLTLFEKTLSLQLLTGVESINEDSDMPNQLNLVDIFLDSNVQIRVFDVINPSKTDGAGGLVTS
jgi:hypothetical protein